MVNWYKNLYTGDTAKKKQKKLMRRIEQGKWVPGVFLLTMPVNPENNLDIIPADLLRQPYLCAHCPMIVGIAVTYEEALEVLEQIVNDVYQNTGGAGIRSWLENSSSV